VGPLAVGPAVGGARPAVRATAPGPQHQCRETRSVSPNLVGEPRRYHPFSTSRRPSGQSTRLGLGPRPMIDATEAPSLRSSRPRNTSHPRPPRAPSVAEWTRPCQPARPRTREALPSTTSSPDAGSPRALSLPPPLHRRYTCDDHHHIIAGQSRPINH
jgi:hypothetical protein